MSTPDLEQLIADLIADAAEAAGEIHRSDLAGTLAFVRGLKERGIDPDHPLVEPLVPNLRNAEIEIETFFAMGVYTRGSRSFESQQLDRVRVTLRSFHGQ